MTTRSKGKRRFLVLCGLGILVMLVTTSAAFAGDGAAKTRQGSAAVSRSTPAAPQTSSTGGSVSRQPVARSTRPPSSGGGGPTARDTRQYAPSGGGGGHGHHGGYYRPWYPGYWGGYWHPYRSWWWWGGYWGTYWGPYWGSYSGWPGYAPSYRVVAPTAKIGALNLKLQPKKAAVYVDGYYVGKAKTFDGRPDFLWLEEGTYEIAFYLEGYRTLTRTFTVRSGAVADVRIALEPGAATLPPEPTQVVAESSPPRKVDRRPAEVESERQVAGAGEEDWRQGTSSSRDVRRDPGRVHLTVRPEDASVYLDGRFLGSGRELAGLHAGLLVDPGQHLLEVVRPGFQPRELDFGVDSGEDLDLEVALIAGGER
jgi:hypothetical protein